MLKNKSRNAPLSGRARLSRKNGVICPLVIRLSYNARLPFAPTCEFLDATFRGIFHNKWVSISRKYHLQSTTRSHWALFVQRTSHPATPGASMDIKSLVPQSIRQIFVSLSAPQQASSQLGTEGQ